MYCNNSWKVVVFWYSCKRYNITYFSHVSRTLVTYSRTLVTYSRTAPPPGQLLGGWSEYHNIRVTKSEYEEHGPNVCSKKLNDSIAISNT